MKRMLIGMCAVVALVGCGGVDRDGTRDQLIKQLKAAGVEADGGCIDDAMAKYSDDELTAIDKALGKGEETAQSTELLTAIGSCVTPTT